MREFLYRVILLALVLSALLTFGGDLRAEPVIVASVTPQVALKNPYQRTTFRLKWVIEPHEDNRRMSIAFTCGSEVHSAQREIDKMSARTTERFVEILVVDDCSFTACVVRISEGRVKTLCDQATVSTGEP